MGLNGRRGGDIVLLQLRIDCGSLGKRGGESSSDPRTTGEHLLNILSKTFRT